MSTSEHRYGLSSLQQLLGQDDSYCYCIPNYQRINVWGDDNVKRFLTDIIEGISRYKRRMDRGDAPSDVFLGTMIFTEHDMRTDPAPHDISGRELRVRKVVDGQQRLTAMSMACTVLHEHMESRLAAVGDLCGQSSKVFRRAEDFMEELLAVATVDQFIPRMIALSGDAWQGTGGSGTYISPLAKHVLTFCSPSNNDANRGSTNATSASMGFDKALKVMRDNVKEACSFGKIEEYELPDVSSACENGAFSKHMLRLAGVAKEELRCDNETMGQVYRAMMLGRFLLTHIKILWLQSTNEDDAIDLFEALNATGVQLTSIETFRPVVVGDITEQKYITSQEKVHFDAVEECIGTGEAQRAKLSTEIVAAVSLAETGAKLRNRHIRTQRECLRNAYDASKQNESAIGASPSNTLEFIRQIHCCAELVDSIASTKEENIGCIALEDKGFFESLDLDRGAGFSLAYAQALGHTSCIPMLSRLYHRLTASTGSDRERELSDKAIRSMCNAVKHVTAYFASMRMLGYPTSAIEADHKSCMVEFARPDDRHGITSMLIKERLAAKLTEAIRGKQRHGAEPLRDTYIKVGQEMPIYGMCQRTAKYLLQLASHKQGDNIEWRSWKAQNAVKVMHVVPDSGAEGRAEWPGNLMLLSSKEHKEVLKLHKVETQWKELLERYARILRDKSEPPIASTAKALRDYLLSIPRIDAALLDGESEGLFAAISQLNRPKEAQPDNIIIKNRGKELAEFAWDTLAVRWLGLESR